MALTHLNRWLFSLIVDNNNVRVNKIVSEKKNPKVGTYTANKDYREIGIFTYC